MRIVPEKTAITNGVATSCKLLINEIIKDKKEDIKVLDYGCGKLRNTKFILENNIKVDILDTPTQIEKNKELINNLDIPYVFNTHNIDYNIKYDIILLSFVLNVIPNTKERENILLNIHKLLKDDGYAYIEVRDYSFIKSLKHKVDYNDGLLIGNNKDKTFQKPFTSIELSEFLSQNNFNIVYIKKTSNSIIAKIEKTKG